MGRPTLLDDLVSKRIVDAVARGCTRAAAAEAAGIHRDTLQEWLARGREGDAEYSDFAYRVEKADAEAENVMVGVVRGVAIGADGEKPIWQAAAWWLERRRPESYAKREVSAGDAGQAAGTEGADELSVAESVVAAIKSRKVG